MTGIATTAAAAIALLGHPASAAQQQDPPPPSEEAPSPSPSPSPAKKPPKRGHNLLVVPIPLSSPSTGPGIAVGGVLFYNPLGEPQQWVSGAGIVYTKRGAKGIAAFHTMSLQQDRLRMKVIAAYTDGPMRYFGTGADAGDSGDSVEFTSKEPHLQVQAQIRAIEHGYVGVRYTYSHYDLVLRDAETETGPLPPPDQWNSTLAMMGPTLSYDTRDGALLPRSGMFLSATWMIGVKALGSSFPHTKIQTSGNFYVSQNSATTIAMRASMCAATGEVPFYDLCMFGSGPDLRGYESGRFRDRASWALQGELRRQLSSRFGAVAFVGVGGIAPAPGKVLTDGNLLPSAGLGVRYRPFRDNDVNLRADLAMGLYGPAVYVGISEAF